MYLLKSDKSIEIYTTDAGTEPIQNRIYSSNLIVALICGIVRHIYTRAHFIKKKIINKIAQ